MKSLRLTAIGLASLVLLIGASSARASVTIGQLDPGTPSVSCGGAPIDVLQPTVTSGNPYVVPPTIAQGTVTSWSHKSRVGTGQMMGMKIFRKIAEPATYLVVGHDGPRPLTGGATETFPASISVKAGDVLGLQTPSTTACGFDAATETVRFRMGDLGDGASGAFGSDEGRRLNITAVVTPVNTFTRGRITRNKKKGTATQEVTVPNPGELTVGGNGVKGAAGATVAVAVGAPGTVTLKIKAKGKKKRKLNKNGKVKVAPTITYTPISGVALTQSRKLKLKKKLKRKK